MKLMSFSSAQFFACFLLAKYGRSGETAEEEMEGPLRGDLGKPCRGLMADPRQGRNRGTRALDI